jgi:SAM-dependent methyltransferase
MHPKIIVLPDSDMRERSRPSLNRLPDLGDWEPGTPLTDYMRDMRSPVGIHRKSWEYGICVEGLTTLGSVQPGNKGLAVGAGSESPLYYFANKISKMVATDLYDNPQHEGKPAMLADPRSFAPFYYREDHLEVLRMSGDDLHFDDGTFDFVFCLSSIEHFGSRDVQRKSFDEIQRVLKPGGIACIITELILTGHRHHEYFSYEEIDEMFLHHPRMAAVGGELDLSISESLIRHPTNMDKSNRISRSPHIVLKQGDMLWTSLSLFLRKI